MRFGKSVLITLLSRGLALPIGVLSSIVTARYLGPSGRGVLAVLIALQGIAVQFGTLGFNASVVHFVSRSPAHAPRVISITILMAVMAGTIAAALVLGASYLVPDALLGGVDIRYLLVFLIAIPFAFLQQFFQNVIIARNQIVEFNALDLGVRVLQLAGFVGVLILLGGSTLEAVLCLAAVTVISGTIYFFRVLPLAERPVRMDWGMLRDMMRYGARNYVASLLMFLCIRVNLFVVNSLLGEAASGQYAVVMQLADLLYLLPMTLGMMLFPRISQRSDGDTVLTTATLRFANATMLGAAAALFFFSGEIIHLLYGDAFLPAVDALRWHLPGIVALSLVMILNNDLAGRGLPAIVMVAPAIGLAVNVGVALAAIPVFGIAGASMASSASYMIIFLLLFGYFVVHFKLSPSQILIPTRDDLRRLRFPSRAE